MNTFVLLGLVLLLVLFLVRSKRKRTSADDDAPSPGRASRGFGLRRREADPVPAPAPPAPQADPFASAGPAPFAASPSPFGGGAPVDSFPPVELTGAAAPFAEAPAPFAGAPTPFAEAPAPVAPVIPAPAEADDWRPEEMIVEPGWPLPGEIAGAWGDGPSGPVAAPVATVEAPTAVLDPSPLAETAATEAPPAPVAEESWDMPALDPVAPPETTPAPAPAPAPEAVLPLWRPEEPVAEPVEDIWIPAEPPVEGVPDPEPLSPVAHIAPAVAPEPVVAPDPEPFVFAEPEPFAFTEPEAEPEPVVVAEPLPVWEPVAAEVPVAEAPVVTAPVVTAPVVTAPPAGWPAEVAELLPAALDAVRPLVAVSDHVGVTPRMLVVMSALSERPLSVGEQAALLGVSRPVVADVAARLESLGLTRREKDPADRRRVRIALTPKGHRLVADAAGTPSPERIAVALAGLDDAGRAALLTALRALAGGASSR